MSSQFSRLLNVLHTKEALIYSLNGYNTDHQLKLHGALGNASTNAR